MLLYAPACRQEDFTNAIGYLVRRLDENTGPDNFLRHAFNIEVGSTEWKTLEQQFVEAFEARRIGQARAPRRTQDRTQQSGRSSRHRICRSQRGVSDASTRPSTPSATSPIPTGRCSQTASGRTRSSAPGNLAMAPTAADVPLVIGGEEILRRSRDSRFDSIRRGPGTSRRPLSPGDRSATSIARRAPRGQIPTAGVAARMRERVEMLHRAADELIAARGDLMGAMLAEGGKTLTESDPEVSEAIDFCRFYADSAATLLRLARPRRPRPRAWSSSSRRGIFRSRFPAAAWPRRSRPATPSFSSRRPTRC